jgi:ABC-type polysaccharide/polyol phosphate transport system ATPase subunit
MRSSNATSDSFPKSCSGADEPPVVELCGVAKRFYHYEHRTRSLRELFVRLLGRQPIVVKRPVFRLQGLDLRVARGESVAIVGANGSGKSTALRLIAGIYPPSAGTVTVRGRLTAVIELGAGLHPELTGRENIGLYASLLGLSRREISPLEPATAEFAELGDFLDVPIKYYSSGMRARLAFSVALCAEPDIFLLDEVLAVGDQGFRERCFERLREFLARGATLIAVSHDMDGLRGICARGVWIDRGQLRMSGEIDAVLEAYRASVSSPFRLDDVNIS